MRSLIGAIASRINIMNFKLLTEHHLEFLSLKVGCTSSSESTLVKVPYGCRKSHAAAQILTEIKEYLGMMKECY